MTCCGRPDAAGSVDRWKVSLDQRASLIANRVEYLAVRCVTSPPAWTRAIGLAPTDESRRHEWQRAIGSVAAYREQFGIPGSEPSPLGPAPEPGTHQHRARAVAQVALTRAAELAAADHRNAGPREPQ